MYNTYNNKQDFYVSRELRLVESRSCYITKPVYSAVQGSPCSPIETKTNCVGVDVVLRSLASLKVGWRTHGRAAEPCAYFS